MQGIISEKNENGGIERKTGNNRHKPTPDVFVFVFVVFCSGCWT